MPTISAFSHSAAAPPGRVEHQQRRALQDEQHRQRDDDVGHAGDDDQDAVDGAEHQAHDQHERHDEQRELLAGAVHHRGGGDAGQRHHRGDGKVDAAGDDDDGLGRDGEREGQHGADQRAEIAGAVVGLDELGEDEQQREQHEQAGYPALAADEPDHGALTGLPGRSARMPTSCLASRGRP